MVALDEIGGDGVGHAESSEVVLPELLSQVIAPVLEFLRSLCGLRKSPAELSVEISQCLLAFRCRFSLLPPLRGKQDQRGDIDLLHVVTEGAQVLVQFLANKRSTTPDATGESDHKEG